jgi:hypothetical protein
MAVSMASNCKVFGQSVAERDIDFILLEELSINDEFCDWFVTRVTGETAYFGTRVGAWHSVWHETLHESDLQFVFKPEGDTQAEIAILVENKINAAAQPQQAARYMARGEDGKNKGNWSDFHTCLVAPAGYLKSPVQTEKYDAELSYEEIAAFFSSRRFRDARYRYKAHVIQEAINKLDRRGAHQPKTSADMTKFASDYIDMARKQFPDLAVQESKPRAPGNTWINFLPRPFAERTEVYHQLTGGFAKVLFMGQAESVDQIREKYAAHLDDDMELEVSGKKSVSIAIAVPKLDPIGNPAGAQSDDARMGLAAISRLVTLVREVEQIPSR